MSALAQRIGDGDMDATALGVMRLAVQQSVDNLLDSKKLKKA